MAGARDQRAGGAFVEIYTTDSKFRQGLANAQSRLRKFGMAASQVGQPLALAGGSIVAAFIPAIQTMSDFNDKMSAVAAVSKASGQDLANLTDKARDLGATTSFTASEVAEGMKFMGMAGLNTTQILEGIPAVLNLARAGMIDLGQASDIATDVMTAFGLEAKDLTSVVDVMAQAATSSNTDIAMMGETFKYVAPIARAAGQDIKETSSAIAILAGSGIKASKAGTDLKNIITVLAKETDILGVKTTDAEGNIRPFLDIMRELGVATKDMTESERVTFFISRFGKIAGASAITLATANTQVDHFREVMDSAGGAADKMAKKMDDNFGGKMRSLMSAVESMFISLGTAVEPILTGLVNKFTEIVRWVDAWAKANPGLVQTILAAAGAATVIGGVLTTLGAAAFALSATLSGLTGLFGGVASVLTVSLLPAISVLLPIVASLAGSLSTVLLPALAIATSAFAGWHIGKFISSFIYGRAAIYGFNDELRKSLQLADKLQGIHSEKNQQILDNASQIQDPQAKQAYFDEQIQITEKELQGAAIRSSMARRKLQETEDNQGIFGDRNIKVDQQEVQTAEALENQRKEFLKTLKEQKKLEQDLAAIKQPFLTIPEQTFQAGQQAVQQFAASQQGQSPLSIPSIDDQEGLVEAMETAMESVFSKLFEKAQKANEIADKLLIEVRKIREHADNFPLLQEAPAL